MSVPPNMMAQMLMQQGTGAAPQSGGAPAGAMQGGSDMIRKIMMIKALQAQQQPGQPPQAQPNMMGGVAAQPQAMQQMQMPGGVNA